MGRDTNSTQISCILVNIVIIHEALRQRKKYSDFNSCFFFSSCSKQLNRFKYLPVGVRKNLRKSRFAGITNIMMTMNIAVTASLTFLKCKKKIMSTTNILNFPYLSTLLIKYYTCMDKTYKCVITSAHPCIKPGLRRKKRNTAKMNRRPAD